MHSLLLFVALLSVATGVAALVEHLRLACPILLMLVSIALLP